mgnify:CR=1 FL=1
MKSMDVWNSPEWRALAAMLGIPTEKGTGITACAIVLDCTKNAEVFVDITKLPDELLAKMRARQ